MVSDLFRGLSDRTVYVYNGYQCIQCQTKGLAECVFPIVAGKTQSCAECLRLHHTCSYASS